MPIRTFGISRERTVPWRSRVLSYDSTFGLQATDAMTLHLNGVPSTFPSLAANPTFDDSESYWSASAPEASVIVPNTGTVIQVTNEADRLPVRDRQSLIIGLRNRS